MAYVYFHYNELSVGSEWSLIMLSVIINLNPINKIYSNDITNEDKFIHLPGWSGLLIKKGSRLESSRPLHYRRL